MSLCICGCGREAGGHWTTPRGINTKGKWVEAKHIQGHYKHHPNQGFQKGNKNPSKSKISKERHRKFLKSLPENHPAVLSRFQKGHGLIGGGSKGIQATKTKKRLLSKIRKKLWKNPEYAKRMFKAIQKKPNDEELYVDALLQLNFPNQWKYVGDGEFLLGGKCPDWMNVNGKKIVIEYNGFNPPAGFGHTPQRDAAKTRHYAKYGFKTINLERKVLKNPQLLIKAVEKVSP